MISYQTLSNDLNAVMEQSGKTFGNFCMCWLQITLLPQMHLRLIVIFSLVPIKIS
ncbi:hypothetical protein RchiOBHm_Chr4g0422281 [Rosa chinensis]|uniref:Uncharacterized protein n=1 Tax=Rosa chinensis TaxID=74649 RepID=A0A2P6QYB9_ROSCH|nr:hypothetical protein RchiOBHm_Chr4g0422281 [Rosa chinensis]